MHFPRSFEIDLKYSVCSVYSFEDIYIYIYILICFCYLYMHDYKIAFVSVHLFKNNVQHTKVRENLSTIRVLIFEKNIQSKQKLNILHTCQDTQSNMLIKKMSCLHILSINMVLSIFIDLLGFDKTLTVSWLCKFIDNGRNNIVCYFQCYYGDRRS